MVWLFTELPIVASVRFNVCAAGAHVHGLGGSLHRQGEVDGGRLIHQKFSLFRLIGKTPCGDRDRVFTGRDRREYILSLAVSRPHRAQA